MIYFGKKSVGKTEDADRIFLIFFEIYSSYFAKA